MLKKGIPFLIILFVIVGIVYIKYSQKTVSEPVTEQTEEADLSDDFAGLKESTEAAPGFKKFTIDENYFSCDIPETWELVKTEIRKNKKGVHGIELVGPRINNAPTLARIKFYSKNNIYFDSYNSFINSNSKDIFGDKKTKTDTYGPVEEIKLNGKIAFRFESEIKEYTDLESKSGDFIMLKEKFYVIPSDKGFHILQFMSSEPSYSKYLPLFDEMVYSFRGV
ncbi:MAG: hypothetical protein KKD35_02430 [Elusimicrobia bacterium]|nr:hypothetical protein [Elusimicrobiota bacterium]